MKPLLPVERLHFDLMQRLPVRTVETRRQFSDALPNVPSPRSRGGRPRTEEVLELNRRLKRLRAAGHTYEEMQAITGAHPNTINRHLNDQVLTAKATTTGGK